MKILLKLALFTTILCVTIQAKPNVRIVGGSDARRGQFPYAAAIYYSTSNGHYFCGGTLVSNQWILTAARCAYEAETFRVLLGVTNIKAGENSEIEVSTSSKEIHPDFSPDSFENDVALIKLHLPLQFSYFLTPANLPFNHISNYSSVIAIGWGQTSDSNPGQADNLQYVTLTSIPNDECKLTYGNQVTDNMVCVVGNNIEGACNGDLGSPLLEIANGGLVAYIVGVSSFLSANGCENADPSGYTRIYPYIDWIKDWAEL